MIPHKPFYFIRHGETDWNRRRIYMGSKDIPLNKAGIEQAKLAAKALKPDQIGHIVTSPLSRAKETAEIVDEAIKKPVTVIEDLRECNLGATEGQEIDHDTILQLWFNDQLGEEAEKFQTFVARIISGLNKSFELPAPILVVGHGGVYYAMQKILGIPRLDLSNCALVYHQPPEHASQPWAVCKQD